jgi:DNA topoisomerase-1
MTRRKQDEVTADPAASAKLAGLHYVSDEKPGIRRIRHGTGFTYRDARDKPLKNSESLARIRSLAVPPAWTDVWICPDADGHLQATGHDARGRKQYRYHAEFRAVRDDAKYGRMLAFAKALPKIRRSVTRDLRARDMPQRKVLAAVVRLLQMTLIRVGNDEYARENSSFGLTTMRNHHAEVNGAKIHFEFRGKSGVRHEIDLHDPALARIISHCQDLPGQELFGYVDEDGKAHDIGSADVNDYLREITGQEFTAKDFRTWAGTVLAAQALKEFETFDSEAAAKRNIVRAIESVAKSLGNTKAVCRKCYIHPEIIDAYLDRSLCETLKARAQQKLRSRLSRLSAEEAAVLTLLQQRLGRRPGGKKPSRQVSSARGSRSR